MYTLSIWGEQREEKGGGLEHLSQKKLFCHFFVPTKFFINLYIVGLDLISTIKILLKTVYHLFCTDTLKGKIILPYEVFTQVLIFTIFFFLII
jgi:hypothetical protein